MPCNAIAMARARLADPAGAALLPGPVLAPVLVAYLQAAYPAWPVALTRTDTAGCRVRVGPYTLTVESGALTATGPDRATADALVAGGRALLEAAAGRLRQAQVRAALAARAPILEEARRADGALVLTLQL